MKNYNMKNYTLHDWLTNSNNHKQEIKIVCSRPSPLKLLSNTPKLWDLQTFTLSKTSAYRQLSRCQRSCPERSPFGDFILSGYQLNQAPNSLAEPWQSTTIEVIWLQKKKKEAFLCFTFHIQYHQAANGIIIAYTYLTLDLIKVESKHYSFPPQKRNGPLFFSFCFFFLFGGGLLSEKLDFKKKNVYN